MYNKLFSKIVDSSVWMEPDHVRLIWMMFIAIMDEDGFVNLASVKNVAHRAVMDLEKATEAIEVLESPDPESSNPANDGRRLTRVPGGWIVNNSKEYRDIVKREHQKELNRERVRKHREKAAKSETQTGCNGPVMQGNENVTPSDTDTEANTDTIDGCAIVALGDRSPVPYQIIAEQFVAAMGGSVRITAKRKTALTARWRDQWWRDNYLAALELAADCPFLRGDNDRGWRMDFEFFCRPDSVTKILEGKYSGQQQRKLTSNELRERANAEAFASLKFEDDD